MTMETENRKRFYQIYHAQELGNCCKNLVSQEQPYAPAKFRTKFRMKILQNMKSPFTDKPLWMIILFVKSNSPRKTKKLDKRNRKHGPKNKRFN